MSVTELVFLVNKSTKQVTYAGAVPKTYKQLTGLQDVEYGVLRDLAATFGEDYKDLGFLTEFDARQAGVASIDISKMKAGAWEIKWSELTEVRSDLIQAQRWRVDRHNDEVALGNPVTEDITPLLVYFQQLRDLPLTYPDPFSVTWPTPV